MMYLRCPFRNEDNDYISPRWDAWHGHIDLECAMLEEMNEDPVVLRISDNILMPSVCDDITGSIYHFGGYTNEQIKTILEKEFELMQECPYIDICNTYFFKKNIIKKIQDLMV